MKLRLICATGLSMFCLGASALDLIQAFDLARLNDPVLRAAISDNEASLENLAIGKSAVLPKVSATYYKAYTDVRNNTSPTQTGNFNSQFSAIQLTQPLYSPEAMARWRQGEAQARLGEYKLAFNQQDLQVRVAQAYTDLLFAIDQFNFQQIERDAMLTQSRQAENLFKRGEASRTDVLEAQSAFEISDAKVGEAKDAVEVARRKLIDIIGQDIADIRQVARLGEPLQLLKLKFRKFEEWQEQALANNPELLALQQQVTVAEQEVAKNNAGHYPVVNLLGTASNQTSYTVNTLGQTIQQSLIGVQMNLPLYTGGETTARTSQALKLLDKTKSDYESARSRILTELRKQFDAVNTNAAKIDSLVKAKASSTVLIDAMQRSLQLGERTQADVMMAQRNLFSVRRDLAQTRYTYLLAYLKLAQQAGELNLDEFTTVASRFTPN